jgi:hypothetical protein
VWGLEWRRRRRRRVFVLFRVVNIKSLERGRRKTGKKSISLPERVRGPLPVPVHPLFQVRLQELEDEVEHGLRVLLDVLDAEQPRERVFFGFSGFFFSAWG